MANYKNLSDTELVDLLTEGDHNAFSEILDRYHTILINFAYRRVADVDLSQDLVQDVFTDLWEKRDKNTINKGLEPYIFTSIRHRVIDHFRKKKVCQAYIENFGVFLSNTENTTDYLVRYNDLSALIDQEIAALPKNMRIVFELSRKTEMNRKQTAEYLSMPENTVKGNMQRALKILRRRLGDVLIMLFLTNL